MGSFSDLTGRAYGRLRVLRHAGWYQQPNGTRGSLWRCLCDPALGGCGAEMDARVGKLNNGHTRSCGCLQKQQRGTGSITHGGTRKGARIPEFYVWAGMRDRCTCPGDERFPRYGGRGITICARWSDFSAFYADMGARPSPAHTIDRIDNDRGYWCGNASCADCDPAGRALNCRWATQKEQARNRSTSRMLEFRGERRCLAEWAEVLGMDQCVIGARLSTGWPVERALTEPVRRRAEVLHG